MDTAIFDRLKAEAEKANATQRKTIESALNELSQAQVLCDDELQACEALEDEARQRRAKAYEAFNAQLLHHQSTLVVLKLSAGGEDNVKALPSKGKEAA